MGPPNEPRRSGVWGISRSAALTCDLPIARFTTDVPVVGQVSLRAGKIVEGSRLVVAVREECLPSESRNRKRTFAVATGYSPLSAERVFATNATHLTLCHLRRLLGARCNAAEMGPENRS